MGSGRSRKGDAAADARTCLVNLQIGRRWLGQLVSVGNSAGQPGDKDYSSAKPLPRMPTHDCTDPDPSRIIGADVSI